MLADRLAAHVRRRVLCIAAPTLLSSVHAASCGASARPSAHPTTVTDAEAPRGDRTRLILAAAVALAGLVWIAQGLGVPIGGGFMVGDRFWALAGALVVVAAAGVAAWPRLRRR